jgi:3-methyl-2-oxobutanoate hydroxymethyltransferase
MDGQQPAPRRVRIPDLVEMKRRGEKIAMLTAYDATFARLLDRAGIDLLLVGDSLGMVILGYENTLPVTLEDVLHHTRAVARGAERALVVADMPFLTAQGGVDDAVRQAGRLIREGAAAVKIEGGAPVLDAVRRLVDIGIPVMGHLGLLPQSVHKLGGFARRATTPGEADRLMSEARALEEAGAFSIVLESIPSPLAAQVSQQLAIPTIGIGAGAGCDGQVLVSYDFLGLYDDAPPFVKQYAHLSEVVTTAARDFVADVRATRFPAPPARKRAGRTERARGARAR